MFKYYEGGSEQAMKMRFAGSFLLASVFTITAMALISILPSVLLFSTELFIETFEKF